MRIAIIVEGDTERAFRPYLSAFLRSRLQERMPFLDFISQDGHIPTRGKLKRVVNNLLRDRSRLADHVIALTDVYTGIHPPEFQNARDAKAKMREWVGEESRFHPHAAQYDFEAWLLPYWPTIQHMAGHNRTAPSGNPELVDHDKPPAYRIKEIFEIGSCRDSYVKPRDAARILSKNDLSTAIDQCSELKAFVNTILEVCGGAIVP